MKCLRNAVAVAFGLLLAGTTCAADNYPSRPVTLIIPVAAAGSQDTVGRMLAEHLRTAWKQPVVVENRPGANSTIGTAQAAAAPPDGYTLLLVGGSLVNASIFYSKPGFDIDRDIEPIGQVASGGFVINASNSAPYSSLVEMIRYAKANPGKLANGSGAGGMFLAFEYFKTAAGIDVLQVPYKGEAPALTDLAGGQIQLVMSSVIPAKPLIEGGRFKALAITSPKRAAALPQVPTVDEAGLPGFSVQYWFGLVAPKGTPLEIRKKIADEVAEWLDRADTIARLEQLGISPAPSSPVVFGKFLNAERVRYREIARRAKIQPE